MSSLRDLRVAVVGLPCHLHSLFNLQHTDFAPWSNSIVLKIGLSCDRVLSDHVMTHLLKRAEIDRSACRYYTFRDTAESGWPGKGIAHLNDGTQKGIPNDWRIRSKDAFTPLRCRLCFDKLNFTADILAADPWGISNDKEGHTILAARTEAGAEAIGHASDNGMIHTTTVDWDRVLVGQRIEEKRSFWQEFMRMQQESQQPVPAYPAEFLKNNSERKHRVDHRQARKLFERSREITQCHDSRSLFETTESFLKKDDVLPERPRQYDHDPIFGIAGIWLPNKGSELMLYAVMFHLKRKYPNARIVPCLDLNRENRSRFGFDDPAAVAGKIDCILDASGFFLGDQWRGHLPRSLAYRWKYRRLASEYILLPQAFGPFANEQVERQARNFLHAASLICSRDERSFEHVETLRSPSVPHFLFPDFTSLVDGIVPTGRENRCDDGVILLPNGKMLEMCTEEEGKRYLQLMNHLVIRLRAMNRRHAILCHQVNDKSVVRRLEQNTGPIPCLSETCSLRIKGILGTAKLVVGSRYHGLISAMNQGVPCIGTSWSHKYRTLFDDFGCSEFLLDDLADFGKLDEAVDFLLSDDWNAKWSRKLKKRAAVLRDQSRRMWNVIDHFMNDKLALNQARSSRHD